MSALRERRQSTRLVDRADRRRAQTLDAPVPAGRRTMRRTRPVPPAAPGPYAPCDIAPQPHAPCDTSPEFAARDALVLAHADLVRSIAYRVGQRLPAHVDRGDLVGVGMIGLLEAATRYRPSTGVPFEA